MSVYLNDNSCFLQLVYLTDQENFNFSKNVSWHYFLFSNQRPSSSSVFPSAIENIRLL